VEWIDRRGYLTSADRQLFPKDRGKSNSIHREPIDDRRVVVYYSFASLWKETLSIIHIILLDWFVWQTTARILRYRILLSLSEESARRLDVWAFRGGRESRTPLWGWCVRPFPQQRPAMAETKIIYHLDEQETPYLIKIPIPAESVTLADFKNVLNKPNYKFFFKSMDDDFG